MIDVFSPDGDFRGFLHDNVTGKRVTIDGLWGLRFGNGAGSGPADTLYFSAGTNGENAGLYGSLTFSSIPVTNGHDHDRDRSDDADEIWRDVLGK